MKNRRLHSACASFSLLITVVAAMQLRQSASMAAEDASTVEARLAETAKYLSSDELEGRGVGTKGLNLAADYIADQFRKIGLKTDLYDGGSFQKFKLNTGSKLGEDNQLTFVGPAKDGQPQRMELEFDEQFNPLSLGGSGKFDLPLVFVGYGISGRDEHYDDYAGINVEGKAVIVLRHEPQQDNPHSAFAGTNNSAHAPYKRKLSNAYEHGAAAVIFCTDLFEIDKNVAGLRKRWQTALDQLAEANAKFKAIQRPSTDDWAKHQTEMNRLTAEVQRLATRLEAAADPLVAFDAAGPDEDGRNFPVLFCQRSVIDKLLQAATGNTLAKLEAEIDKGPTPHSQELTGWRVTGETSVKREEAEVKNVIGLLEGEGPHANETIVIGAHYDHLGYGGNGSLAPNSREIHNGADDNGSGTTALIEIARLLASRPTKPARRIVFIAFTGEERGLIGSARYVREPLFPLDSTVAMLNLDMVGRLSEEKLLIHGTGTAKEFDALADRYGKSYGFKVTKDPGGFGPSDHASFYGAKVPVLFFFTDTHRDYHRPSDDFEKLNIGGMRRIAAMVGEIALELAAADERPHYLEAKGKADATGGGGGGDRPYFGSVPDFANDQPGLALSGVTKDGPADRGGLKAGDVIVQLGESKIGNLEDFDSALRKHKAGDKVPVVVMRAGQQVKLEVTLDDPR